YMPLDLYVHQRYSPAAASYVPICTSSTFVSYVDLAWTNRRPSTHSTSVFPAVRVSFASGLLTVTTASTFHFPTNRSNTLSCGGGAGASSSPRTRAHGT